MLEAVPREGVLGLEDVWSSGTNPVESDADGLEDVPSNGTNPVEPEVDGLGGTELTAVKLVRLLAAHSLTCESGC